LSVETLAGQKAEWTVEKKADGMVCQLVVSLVDMMVLKTVV
jgi:hypothetical protein